MTMPARTPPPVLMIVEDSDEDFDTVQEAVRNSGVAVNVRRATTGDACLKLLRGEGCEPLRPAVILMDLNLPGTDGREALAFIKSEPSLRNLPVVVHTTSSNPRDLAFCYGAGVNAYHVKPVRYEDHLDTLLNLLNYWLKRVVLPGREGPPS
ncbi:MAG: response regulator [Isosphaeraceae bacterium]